MVSELMKRELLEAVTFETVWNFRNHLIEMDENITFYAPPEQVVWRLLHLI